MNINKMLQEETTGLIDDCKYELKKFLNIALKEDLRQEDWDVFWKAIHDRQYEDKKFDVTINGRKLRLSKVELKYIDRHYGFNF